MQLMLCTHFVRCECCLVTVSASGPPDLTSTAPQAGHFHVNNKANAEVIAELESHGFIHDSEATRRLRAHTKLPWLSQTVMVFHKASEA